MRKMDRRSYLKTHLGIGMGCFLPAGVSALVGCSGIESQHSIAGFEGKTMGTRYSVRVAGALPHGLADDVHATLVELDGRMSTWQPTSELSRFNFTKSPLVDLWGFGAGSSVSDASKPNASQEENGSFHKPSRSMIEKTKSRTGYQSIVIDSRTNAVKKLNPVLQLDLSGIAKGFAVDQVAKLLNSAGVENYLVEVGGELRSNGRKPDGTAWRIAIEQPVLETRGAYRIIDLEEKAIATSGDYRHFFSLDDQRYSHSIDPHSGYPVNHKLASVTVVAENAMLADALSTAMMVMGTEKALQFSNSENVSAHFIIRAGNKFREKHSESFKPLLS